MDDTDELSEEQIREKMDSLAKEYFQKTLPDSTYMGFENLSVAFTYLHTIDLLKVTENLERGIEKLNTSTDKLNNMTGKLIWLTSLLGILAVFQIVLIAIQIAKTWSG